MLNHVVLMGRMTRDVEVRYSQSQNGEMAVGRFSIAVDRYTNSGDENKADFINCVAFGKTAEFISKYFGKGNMLAVIGRITTGSYTNKDGVKVYTTDVVVERASFTGEKRELQDAVGHERQPSIKDSDGFMKVEESIEDELPF